jgi:hypothetical protein
VRENRNTYGGLVEKSEERGHLEDLGLDGSILVKCKRNRMGRVDWLDLA